MITESQLAQLIPSNEYVSDWCEQLNKFLPTYSIDTNKRCAAFISQCAHESKEFEWLHENLNYRATSLLSEWPTHFANITIANRYAHNSKMIANRVYANRLGNGDEASGDGWAFCGRGLIQLTGREIYQKFADESGKDITELAEYLQTFEGAVLGACFFWQLKKLNTYADEENILEVTKKINGGTNGLEDRTNRYRHCLLVLGN